MRAAAYEQYHARSEVTLETTALLRSAPNGDTDSQGGAVGIGGGGESAGGRTSGCVSSKAESAAVALEGAPGRSSRGKRRSALSPPPTSMVTQGRVQPCSDPYKQSGYS